MRGGQLAVNARLTIRGLLYDVSMSGPDGLYPLFFLAFGLLAGALSSLSLSRNYISMLMLNAGEMLVLDLLRYFCYLLPQKGASTTRRTGWTAPRRK